MGLNIDDYPCLKKYLELMACFELLYIGVRTIRRLREESPILDNGDITPS